MRYSDFYFNGDKGHGPETIKEWLKQWGFLFTGKIVQNCFTLESALGIE